MESIYPSKIGRGGNSSVIRLPQAARRLSDLGENVVLEVTPGKITVTNQENQRAFWQEQTERAFAQQRETSDEAADRELLGSTAGDGIDEAEDQYWLEQFAKACK